MKLEFMGAQCITLANIGRVSESTAGLQLWQSAEAEKIHTARTIRRMPVVLPRRTHPWVVGCAHRAWKVKNGLA